MENRRRLDSGYVLNSKTVLYHVIDIVRVVTANVNGRTNCFARTRKMRERNSQSVK